jgi:hypothetical protein
MRNRIVWVVIVAVALVAIAVVTRGRHLGPTLAAFGMVAAIIALGMAPKVRAWMARRRWVAIAAGLALIAAGIVLPLALADRLAADWAIGGAVMAVVAGVALVLMPGTAARFDQAYAALPTIRKVQAMALPADFSGPREAAAAVAELAARPLAWLAIAGPWIVLQWAELGLLLAVGHGLKPASANAALVGIAALLAMLLFMLVGLIAIAVAWSRTVLNGAAGRIPALPDRATWSLLWPLILVFLVSQAGERSLAGAAHWIDVQLGPSAPVGGEGIMAWIVGALVAFYLAMVGLALPAKAVGDRAMTGGVSRAAVRRLGLGYFLGLACIALPWMAVSLALDWLGASFPVTGPVGIAVGLAGLPVNAAFVAVAAGYLARVYARVAPAVEAAAAS